MLPFQLLLFGLATFTDSRLTLQTASQTYQEFTIESPAISAPTLTTRSLHSFNVRDDFPSNLNTCGFISGDNESPLDCLQSSVCSFDTTIVGCCVSKSSGSTYSCTHLTTCYDSGFVTLVTQLDSSALSEISNAAGTKYPLACTESTRPYRALYTFTDEDYNNYSTFTCTDTFGLTISVQISTNTVNVVAITSTAANTPAQEQGDTDSGSSTLSQATITTDDNSNDKVVPITPSDQPSKSKKSGAIAGGVVGGLAAVLLVLSLSVVYRRRISVANARPTEPSFNILGSNIGNVQDRQTRMRATLNRRSSLPNPNCNAGTDVAEGPPIIEAESYDPIYLPYRSAALGNASKELAADNVGPKRPVYQSLQYQPAHTNSRPKWMKSGDFSELSTPQTITPALRGHHSMSSIVTDRTDWPIQYSATNSRLMSPEPSISQQQSGTRFSELEAHAGNFRDGHWARGMLELP